jgi:polyhydroxyalkanoate synthesis regulator phasin
MAERTAVLREKEATAAARAREVELDMLLTQARSSASTMKTRIDELEGRVRLLEAEREQFLAGFVERTQISSAPGVLESENPDDQTDLAALAGFIAELREKIEQLKLWKSAAQKAGITLEENAYEPSVSISVSTLAERFDKSGRLNVIPTEASRNVEQFATRAERSLYESAVEDLKSADPERRKRAADCLRALGLRDASSLIIAVLNRESDPAVKVALLSALASVGEPSAAAVAIRELADPRPEVRVAAIDAAASLAKEHAEPALIGVLNDPNSVVRRRAVLLLSFITSNTATNALISMMSDRDAGVARIAAQALSGRSDIQSQSALIKSLNHQEISVRQCAADAVMSWSGEMVDPNASAVERRRAARRVADKLTRIEDGALRKAVNKATVAESAKARVSGVQRAPEAPSSISPGPKPKKIEKDKNSVVNNDSVVVAQVTIPGEKKQSALEASLLDEIRTSLRGRTVEELSQLSSTEMTKVAALLSTLVKRGEIAQRGSRFFMS